MRCIAVKEKCLEKQGKKPVGEKEDKYDQIKIIRVKLKI